MAWARRFHLATALLSSDEALQLGHWTNDPPGHCSSLAFPPQNGQGRSEAQALSKGLVVMAHLFLLRRTWHIHAG